ncbi:MAG: HEPN domain-containing protein [Saprospiraceae bacterium]|nr:HEPN domain-containing protein [Saprospiraceae bacterium]
MLSKHEHIAYWVRTAEDDWEAAQSLFEASKYVHCLFFAHLVLEKYCKAHWVKDNHNNHPPKTHNLLRLIQDTHLDLIEEDLLFLEQFNDFQLEGRYPDYLFTIQKRCTFEYTQQLLEKVTYIKQCLQEKLP